MADIANALSGSVSRDGLGGMRAPLNLGGNKATNAAPGTASTDLATLGQVASPIGVIFDFAGTVVPTGYLLCAGQSVNRADYPDLFTAIGTAWGAGDGATTFNIPDLRGRVTAGKDNMAGTAANRLALGATLAATGGEEAHVLTVAELAAHTHNINDPGHSHVYTIASGSGGLGGAAGLGQFDANTGTSTTGITVQPSGSGTAHNNVQPTAIVNKIIKATL
jgi:microcystin-dependent protein